MYIPTVTSKVLTKQYENILYSPNLKHNTKYKGINITIWDNYTFYLYKKYHKKDKHEKARDHYFWLIDYIKENWEEGITLITPDVEWCKYQNDVEALWLQECSQYPQLYVPNTWNLSTDNLNIIGYALRVNSPEIIHENWTHCLGHKRDLPCKLCTYDAFVEL